MGQDNASTTVIKREKIINQARRQFYSERQWSFLFKSATVIISPAQTGSLPSDFNKKFEPIDVYTYTGAVKYQYTRVDFADVGLYSSDQYVYAIDKPSGQIKINQSGVVSVTMDYTYLPADRPINQSEDSDTEPAPDITPIGLLAVAKWWLSSERATGKYQLFQDEYNQALAKAILVDASAQPVRPIHSRSMGIRTAYQGRWKRY